MACVCCYFFCYIVIASVDVDVVIPLCCFTPYFNRWTVSHSHHFISLSGYTRDTNYFSYYVAQYYCTLLLDVSTIANDFSSCTMYICVLLLQYYKSPNCVCVLKCVPLIIVCVSLYVCVCMRVIIFCTLRLFGSSSSSNVITVPFNIIFTIQSHYTSYSFMSSHINDFIMCMRCFHSLNASIVLLCFRWCLLSRQPNIRNGICQMS